jgi:Mu transposase, C-terminal domain
MRADADRVQVFCDGHTAADHARVWATHQTIPDPDHVAAAKVVHRCRFERGDRV